MKDLKLKRITKIMYCISTLPEECEKIFHCCDIAFLKHRLRIQFQAWGDKKDRSSLESTLTLSILKQIKGVNQRIEILNRNLVLFNSGFNKIKIKKIRTSKLVVQRNLKTIFKKIKVDDKVSIEAVALHAGNSLTLYLNSLINPVLQEVGNVVDHFEPDTHPLLEKVSLVKAYEEQIFEIVDLFTIGYKLTALLVLGKTFEEILTRYLLKLSNAKKVKINSDVIKEMEFDKKLNFLKSKNFVNHKDWLIISKLLWDRNVGGHFVGKQKRTESIRDAEATIRLSLPLIKKYDNKINFS